MYGNVARRDAGREAGIDRRRNAILDAAVDLIGSGGPDAITHRAVAARARMPLGSLTYHFPTRQGLVRAAFRHHMRAGRAWVWNVAAGKSDVSARGIVAFVVELARREADVPKMVRTDYELILYAAGDAALAREFAAEQQGFELGLAPLLERLGATRPIDAARTVIDLLRGYEIERFINPEADPEDLGRRLLPVVEALTAPSAQRTAGPARARKAARETRCAGRGRRSPRA